MDNLFLRKDRSKFNLRSLVKKSLQNKRLTLGVVLGLPIAIFLLFGSHGIVPRVRMVNQKAELEQKIRMAEAEGKRLQAEVKALDGDRKAMEKVAREKHGMIREGETVYRVKKTK